MIMKHIKPAIISIGLAFGMAAQAEINLMDAAKEAATSELGKPTDAVPAVPKVSEAAVDTVATPSLTDSLTNSLGVTPEQAEGGAGSLFQFAKQKLGTDDFQAVSDAVPGMDNLLGAAPKSESTSALAGGLASIGGGSLGNAAGAASLMENFQQLGLSSDMVGKFVPVVVDYVKSQGGETVANLLASALTGL